MRVINKKVKQKILEKGYKKFEDNWCNKLLSKLLFPLTYYYSKKYQPQFLEFCFSYQRDGTKQTQDGKTIDFNSFENHYNDCVVKNLTQYNYPVKWEDENWQEFFLENDKKQKISCLTVEQKKPTKKWVIGFHGWTENKFLALRLVTYFYQLGYNILTFDNTAHGKTYGKYSDTGMKSARDTTFIVDWLKKEKGAEVIGLIGNSMGASTINYYLLNYAKKGSVTWAIPDCGFTSLLVQFRFVMQYRFKKPWWLMGYKLTDNHYKFVQEKVRDYDFLEKSKTQYKNPVLLIHGKADDFVPFFHADVIVEHQKDNPNFETLFLDDINHVETLFKAHDQYTKKIDQFIAKAENQTKKVKAKKEKK